MVLEVNTISKRFVPYDHSDHGNLLYKTISHLDMGISNWEN